MYKSSTQTSSEDLAFNDHIKNLSGPLMHWQRDGQITYNYIILAGQHEQPLLHSQRYVLSCTN